jgi:hypothetical protein
MDVSNSLNGSSNIQNNNNKKELLQPKKSSSAIASLANVETNLCNYKLNGTNKVELTQNSLFRKVFFNLSSQKAAKEYSYSYSSVLDTKSINHTISIDRLIGIIKEPPHSAHKKIPNLITQYVKGEGLNKKDILSKARQQKLKLPWLLLSGTQLQGHNNKDISYNGAIQIDIDIKEIGGNKKALEIKEKLSKLPFVQLACISPSSYGVKAIVHTTNYYISIMLRLSVF